MYGSNAVDSVICVLEKAQKWEKVAKAYKAFLQIATDTEERSEALDEIADALDEIADALWCTEVALESIEVSQTMPQKEKERLQIQASQAASEIWAEIASTIENDDKLKASWANYDISIDSTHVNVSKARCKECQCKDLNKINRENRRKI